MVDPSFRAEFRRDPIEISQAYGLGELAEEFRAQGNGIHTLELRESKSSLAGVVMAIAAEGIGLAEVRGHARHGGHGPGQAAALKALKGAGVKTPSGGAAGLAKAAGLHGVPGAGAHGKGLGAVLPHTPVGGASPLRRRRSGCRAPLPPAVWRSADAGARGCRSRWMPAPAGGCPCGGGCAGCRRRPLPLPRRLRAPQAPPLRGRSGAGVTSRRGRGGRRRGSGAAPPEAAAWPRRWTPPNRPAPVARARGPAGGRGQRGAGTQRPLPPRGLPQRPPAMPGGGSTAAAAAQLLASPNLSVPASARALLASGSADPRLLSVLSNAVSHHTIVLGDAESVVDPVHAQAVDIVAVDGQPVGPANVAARDLITEIAALDPSVRPNEIGTPWPIESPGFFTDPTQAGRLHLAFVSPADFQPGAAGAGAGAAAASVGPAPATPAAAGAAQAAAASLAQPPAAAGRRWRIRPRRPPAALAGRALAEREQRWLISRPPADDRWRRGLAAGQPRRLPTRGR